MRHFLCLDPDKVAVEDDGMVATADGDKIRQTLPDFRNPSQPWRPFDKFERRRLFPRSGGVPV